MANITKIIRNYPFWGVVLQYRKRYLIGILSLVFVDAANVVVPLATAHAIDSMIAKNYRGALNAAFLILGMMSIASVMRYLWRIYIIGTSHFVAKNLRNRLYDHLQHLPIHYYQRVRTGDLMSRATNDIEAIREAVGPGILVTVDAVIVFLMILPAMLSLSVKLTVMAFLLYPLVPVLTSWLGNRIDRLFESQQEKLSNLSAQTQESFNAIRLLKALVMESTTKRKFCELSILHRENGIKLSKYEAILSPSLRLLTDLGTLLILFVGVRDTLNGLITLGTFVAFQRFVVQLSWPMEAIGWAVTMNREGIAAKRRLDRVFSQDRVPSTLSHSGEKRSSSHLLEIKDLSFERGHFKLRLSDLKLAASQKIGIVGPVGSGKSTLFELILRLTNPPQSSIYFKGEDIRAIPLNELRNQIGSVEQEVFLFSEPVIDNVSMGAQNRPSNDLGQRATELSEVLEEIHQFESGFQTRLGERGVNLSGGQKQRLALARAIVRHPKLLLLDDSFSAVDVQVEQRIIKNLVNELPGCALILASHRLSMMPLMDEIWVLDEGRLSAKGNHHELMARSSLYQSLWQQGSEPEVHLERPETELAEGPA